MSHTIAKHIISALLATASWDKRPQVYGDTIEGYGTAERVAAAGTSFTELATLDLTVQGDTHDRYQTGWTSLSEAEKDRRNRNYRLAHGGSLQPDTRVNAKHRNPDGMYVVGSAGVDARVNPDTSPSGLRPRILKAHHKSDTMRAWYSALTTAVANTPDGGTVTIPDIDALGGVPGVSPDSASVQTRTRTAQGPTGYRAHLSYRGAIAATLTDWVSLLRNAELPDATLPLADALERIAFQMPVDLMDKVSADAFDTTVIRVGSKVSLLPGVPQHAAVKFMARGLPQIPDVFSVVSIDGTMAMVTADGFKKDLPCPLVSLRRYVPITVVPTTTAWAPSVGLCAWIGGVMEVLVVSIDGDAAKVMGEDGEEVTVLKSDLTASAA